MSLATTMLPWSFKIVYGLISDNLPICGSKRKSYLLIAAFMQFMSMILLTFNPIGNLKSAIFLLFVSNMGVALGDVIADSLMCIQSRKYPEEGSEELTSYCWTCLGAGGLIGATVAAILTERFEPKYCFLYSSVMGFVMTYVAYRLNIEVEREGM